MKKLTILAAAAGALGIVSLASQAQAQCTNASLSGTYALTLSGTVNGFRLAGAGQAIADGAGGITGSLSLSKNGRINESILTGSYSIVSNCIGKLVLNVPNFQAANFDIFLKDGGLGFTGVQTNFNTTVTLDAKSL